MDHYGYPLQDLFPDIDLNEAFEEINGENPPIKKKKKQGPDLSEYSRHELEAYAKNLLEDLDEKQRQIDFLKDSKLVKLIDGTEVWIISFDPANPPSQEELEGIADTLSDCPIVAIPNTTSINTLNESDLEALGLKKIPAKSPQQEYEDMLAGRK